MVVKKRDEDQARKLKLLSEYLPISKIANLLNKSSKTIYKSFLIYRKKGWINEDRSLTSEGLRKVELAIAGVQKVENTIRLHNLVFLVNIPRPIKINKLLELKNIFYKTIDMGTWNAKQIIIDNRKVWINPKKIIFYMDNYYGNTPLEAFTEALNELKQLVLRIQQLLNIKLIYNNSIDFSISRQHYALIKNQLAKQYNKEKKKLFVYDSENRLRLLIDKSPVDGIRIDEFEAVDKELSREDADKVQPFFKDILEKDHYKPSEEKNMLDTLVREGIKTTQDIRNLTTNIGNYNESILLEIKNKKLHLKVLSSMDKTLKSIRDEKKKRKKKLSEFQTKLFV